MCIDQKGLCSWPAVVSLWNFENYLWHFYNCTILASSRSEIKQKLAVYQKRKLTFVYHRLNWWVNGSKKLTFALKRKKNNSNHSTCVFITHGNVTAKKSFVCLREVEKKKDNEFAWMLKISKFIKICLDSAFFFN